MGSGSLKDSIDNPGMVIFLEHLENYMLNSIIEAERQKDSLIGGIWEKLDVETGTKATSLPSISVSSPEATSIVYPLVRVEWGQGAPFNNSLKYKGCTDKDGNIKNGGRVLVGCVAVAVAQIMSYWKHPTKMGKYSFDWKKLNEYTGNEDPLSYRGMAIKHITDAHDTIISQVANLMKQIGSGVNMDYRCDKSGASRNDAVNFLLDKGFLLPRKTFINTTATLISYSSKEAIASMEREEPLILAGCSKKEKILFLIPIYDECHEWVIDGYIRRQTPVPIGGKRPISFEDDYIHNNWGWGGNHNGYFKSGVFASLSDNINPDPKTKSYEAKNYRYNVEMPEYIYW
jgi:hypothetical protein